MPATSALLVTEAVKYTLFSCVIYEKSETLLLYFIYLIQFNFYYDEDTDQFELFRQFERWWEFSSSIEPFKSQHDFLYTYSYSL